MVVLILGYALLTYLCKLYQFSLVNYCIMSLCYVIKEFESVNPEDVKHFYQPPWVFKFIFVYLELFKVRGHP